MEITLDILGLKRLILIAIIIIIVIIIIIIIIIIINNNIIYIVPFLKASKGTLQVI